MDSIVELVFRTVFDTAIQVIYIGGMFGVFTVVLLQLERIISGMLLRTFGPRSIFLTGWLGTPVHELSHAAMCLVFLHKIEKMALFSPNMRTGVLGYVSHSYNPKNFWARLGCAFIGMAPLFGGALALILAMDLLVPSDPLGSLKDFGSATLAAGKGPLAQAKSVLALSMSVFDKTFTQENFGQLQFWLFLYLALCIGTHIAPSKEDFKGSYSGFGALILALFIVNLIAHLEGGVGTVMLGKTVRVVMPMMAMLLIATVLNFASLLGVFVIVVGYRMLRGQSLPGIYRAVIPERKRLAIVASIGLVLFLAATRL